MIQQVTINRTGPECTTMAGQLRRGPLGLGAVIAVGSGRISGGPCRRCGPVLHAKFASVLHLVNTQRGAGGPVRLLCAADIVRLKSNPRWPDGWGMMRLFAFETGLSRPALPGNRTHARRTPL